jgi:hypothetical protein
LGLDKVGQDATGVVVLFAGIAKEIIVFAVAVQVEA